MSALRIDFGFIPFPLAVVDEGADLTLGEYRLLGYLLRHRFRVKSERLRLTQDELLRGALAPGGGRCDKGSGITSGRDLRQARANLEARGWLRVAGDAVHGTVYELRLNETPEEAAAGDAGAKCTHGGAGAFCSVSGCNLSRLQVQNAPEVIRKRSEKREVKQVRASGVVDAGTSKEPKPSCEMEGGARLELVPAEPKSVADPRFAECVAAVRAYVEFKGFVLKWGPAEGAQLKRLLKESPGLSVNVFKDCLRARSKSAVSHGEPPCVWLPTLLKYQDGVQDRYRVPEGGANGTSIGVAGGPGVGSGSPRTDSNYAAAARVYDSIVARAAGPC